MTTEVADISAVIKYLSEIDNIVKRNKYLEEQDIILRGRVAEEQVRVREYRYQMKELQDSIKNYAGALRRRDDEITVLYRKITTLLGGKAPATREAMQEYLDEIAPSGISFQKSIAPYAPKTSYSLKEHGSKDGENPVSDYPDQKMGCF